MTMFLSCCLLLIFCVYKTNESQVYKYQKFESRWNANKAPHRILELMRSYYEEANVRIADLNDMRFMYEESPHYEMGYVISEIIERFRKVVEHAQRPFQFNSDTVIDVLKRVELVQKLYFEIYHLVRMVHETPIKYRGVLEFAGGIEADAKKKSEVDGAALGLLELHKAQENLAALQKRREKERRKKKKLYEKMRQAYLKGQSGSYNRLQKEYNKNWPIDYGWEIDYWW